MPASVPFGKEQGYGSGILFGVFLFSTPARGLAMTVVLALLASLGFENPGYHSSAADRRIPRLSHSIYMGFCDPTKIWMDTRALSNWSLVWAETER